MSYNEKKHKYSKEELIEFRKMQQAFKRGRNLFNVGQPSIEGGLRQKIEEIEREAALTHKHKSSVEVVLSFLAGITVGSIKATHKFIFPSLPDQVDVSSEVSSHKKR